MSGSLLMVNLDPTSEQYRRTVRLFHTTGPGFQVIKVEQIQNQTLYRQYAAKREEVRNHVTQGVQVEQELFHGTTEDVCEKIWKGGFNRSYAGKNGEKVPDLEMEYIFPPVPNTLTRLLDMLP
uniref:PARP catalytic domain-containing protein n=1 Tax=Ciona savignyi TaxID=51511 RepID=H2YWJ9_CIOSA